MSTMEGSPADQHVIEIPQKTLNDLVDVLSRLANKDIDDDDDDDFDAIEVHQKALDDLVTVNSLFTLAVFVGLSFATPGQRSLEERAECDAGNSVAKRLILYEVVSFACFLLSSLVAKTLKFQLEIYRKNSFQQLYLKVIRGTMLSLSGASSLVGIVFLTISMVDLIQIRLGKLSCGSQHSIRAAGVLISIVCLALLIYIPSTVFGIIKSMQHVELKKKICTPIQEENGKQGKTL